MSTTIANVLFSRGMGGFFYDDQAAIRLGAPTDGFAYAGSPVTPGFAAIRIPATSLGIGLQLSDGATVWGDMMSVQYSGAGGRDPLFDAQRAEAFTRNAVLPRLLHLSPMRFRDCSARVLAASEDGTRVPVAIAYGVSQALLRATAYVNRTSMAEVVCDEFHCPLIARPVPIFAQSGDQRRINVDKMILKRADILPQGLINSHANFGTRGEAFREFVRWVVRRIERLGSAEYRPTLHFDVYGWIGFEFGSDPEAIADFIARVAEECAPLDLNIECPADFGSRDAQISGYGAIRSALAKKGSSARIVVDERCNTLDDIRAFALAGAAHLIQIKTPDVGSIEDIALAVLHCKAHGVGAYVGGSCVETDLSAAVSVHVALATQADMLLAKPGMGVDEALSIVGNEQNRLVSLLQNRLPNAG